MRLSKSESLISIIGIFLLLGFVPPAYLNQNLGINRILDFLRLSGFLAVLILYIIDFGVHIKKISNWLMAFLWIELLLSTIISKNVASIHTYIGKLVVTFGLTMLAEEISIRNLYAGIKAFYIYFSACVLVNTFTVFLFPNAMYANNRGIWVCWFLGEDNTGYAYYIAALVITMMYCHYIAKRITLPSLLVWLCSFVFVLQRDIVTGKICQFVWLALVIIYFSGYYQRLLKASYYIYITIFGFIFLVLTRIMLIAPIITAFNRDVSLGRTMIWDRVLIQISKYPILGLGICSDNEFDHMIMNNGLVHAHNWFLMLLFYGGIIAAFLFVCMCCFGCLQAKAYRDTKYYQYLALGLIVYSIRFLVEVANVHFLYMFCAMLAYSREFIENIKDEGDITNTSCFALTGIPQIKVSLKGSRK